MKVLVAPDSYKNSLSAYKACQAIREALYEEFPSIEVILQPVSDGGEGFAEAFFTHDAHARWKSLQVMDPLMRRTEARYLQNKDVAIVEMARASGLELVEKNLLNPVRASTYGTGQLIDHLYTQDVSKVIIGLGGSATHDAGLGFARAMGIKFLSADGSEITEFVHVATIHDIVFPPNWKKKNMNIIVAADVVNPLLGSTGAAKTYAAQKGASPEEIERLESLTETFADVIENYLGHTYRNYPGAGAAGGMGFILMALLDAVIKPGFDVLAEITGIETKIKGCSLVITGEGRLDEQTAFGKAPEKIRQMAGKLEIPCAGIFGQVNVRETEYDRVYSLSDLAGSVEKSIANPIHYIKRASIECLRFFTRN